MAFGVPTLSLPGGGVDAVSGAHYTAPQTSSTGGVGANSAIGGASVGIAIGQAIGAMYGAWQTGRTTKYVMGKQAEIAEHNRQRGQMAAESAYRAAEGQAAQLTYQAGQLEAKQRTAYAANGVALGEGSSAEVLASSEVMKKIDMKNLRMNALATAWGYKNQALQAGGQEASFGRLGSAYQASEMGKGFSGMLEGATLAADRWYRFYGKGA